jgi:hypothetical protein
MHELLKICFFLLFLNSRPWQSVTAIFITEIKPALLPTAICTNSVVVI